MELKSRPPITEVLRAATAQERAETTLPPAAQLSASHHQDDENTIRAGAINLLIERAHQLKRQHITGTDMRRFDIVVGAIMREPAKGDAVDADQMSRIAVQTQEIDPAPAVLDAIERELARES